MQNLLCAVAWFVPSLIGVIGAFWLLAEFGWRLEHRPVSFRRAKKEVNATMASARNDLTSAAQDYRAQRSGGWW